MAAEDVLNKNIIEGLQNEIKVLKKAHEEEILKVKQREDTTGQGLFCCYQD